jgi:membrane protease YdiL (CAAX protease family)
VTDLPSEIPPRSPEPEPPQPPVPPTEPAAPQQELPPAAQQEFAPPAVPMPYGPDVWLKANLAPIAVICLSFFLVLTFSALAGPRFRPQAAEATLPPFAPEDVTNMSGLGIVGGAIMLLMILGGAGVWVIGAIAWFAVPETRPRLRNLLLRFAVRPWPALRLLDFFAMIAAYLAYMVLASLLLADFVRGLPFGQALGVSALAHTNGMVMVVLTAVALAHQRAGGPHGSLGIWPFWKVAPANPPRSVWLDVALGAAAYPLCLWIETAAALINRAINHDLGIKEDQNVLISAMRQPQPAWVLAALIVAAVIGAPLLEELVFRGILYNALRRYCRGILAAVAAALFFAALHMVWSNLLQLFVLALILTWLYERTGRLVASISLHAVNNLVALLLVLSLR